jgi:hypothetical protein
MGREEGESRAWGYHLLQMRRADEREHPVFIIAEENIAQYGDEPTFQDSCVRHVCHLDCWDGIEENEYDEF